MFSIQEKFEDGFNKILIIDEEAKTFIEILPECGAILNAFSITNETLKINTIDNYKNFDSYKNNIEASGFKSVKLSPFVCRMHHGEYTFGQTAYKINKFYLGDHAIHGLLYDAEFTVVEKNIDEESASVSLMHAYRKKDNGYPFDYDCIITYALKKQNSLTLTTQIINKDAGNIPMADGWHPYFTFGGSLNHLQLEFQSKAMVEFDEKLLPTGNLIPYQAFGSLKKIGETFFDNCFTVNFAECQPMLVLRDTQKKMQLEIYPDKSYPYLQIYTPPHRQSIAIENLSAAPDAFNNGMNLQILAAGEQAKFYTTYKISFL